MADELLPDFEANVRADLTRLLQSLKDAGWNVEPILWEPNWDRKSDRRVCFKATSKTGQRFQIACPEKSLPVRLAFILDSAGHEKFSLSQYLQSPPRSRGLEKAPMQIGEQRADSFFMQSEQTS